MQFMHFMDRFVSDAGKNAMQKRLMCKCIAKLVAIYNGIQIYPVYSVEARRTTFYPICFRT